MLKKEADGIIELTKRSNKIVLNLFFLQNKLQHFFMSYSNYCYNCVNVCAKQNCYNKSKGKCLFICMSLFVRVILCDRCKLFQVHIVFWGPS